LFFFCFFKQDFMFSADAVIGSAKPDEVLVTPDGVGSERH
jgi:hypothetical protein